MSLRPSVQRFVNRHIGIERDKEKWKYRSIETNEKAVWSKCAEITGNWNWCKCIFPVRAGKLSPRFNITQSDSTWPWTPASRQWKGITVHCVEFEWRPLLGSAAAPRCRYEKLYWILHGRPKLKHIWRGKGQGICLSYNFIYRYTGWLLCYPMISRNRINNPDKKF